MRWLSPPLLVAAVCLFGSGCDKAASTDASKSATPAAVVNETPAPASEDGENDTVLVSLSVPHMT